MMSVTDEKELNLDEFINELSTYEKLFLFKVFPDNSFKEIDLSEISKNLFRGFFLGIEDGGKYNICLFNLKNGKVVVKCCIFGDNPEVLSTWVKRLIE